MSLTVTNLAKILGVNRRQITRWRAESNPGPAGTDPQQWRVWLKRTGRIHQHAALERWLADPATGPDSAGPNKPAAQEEQAPKASPRTGYAPLPSTASDAERQQRAKAEAAELDLEAKRLEVEERQGRLLPIEVQRRLAGAISGLLAEALAGGVWQHLAPLLDGLSADDRKRLRAAHDRGFIALRTRLADEIRERFATIVEP